MGGQNNAHIVLVHEHILQHVDKLTRHGGMKMGVWFVHEEQLREYLVMFSVVEPEHGPQNGFLARRQII